MRRYRRPNTERTTIRVLPVNQCSGRFYAQIEVVTNLGIEIEQRVPRKPRDNDN